MKRLPNLSVLGALTALAAAAPSQSWTASAAVPAGAFGARGDLIGATLQGIVGFDEQQGRTIRPFGIGWVSYLSSVPKRMFSTLSSSSGHVYVFGGVDAANGQFLNDLWRFNYTINDWELMSAGGASVPGPSPRFGCKSAPFGSGVGLVFFGGTDGSGVSNETWVMADIGWLVPPIWGAVTTPPGLVARTGHSMSRGPDGSAVLFGGDAGGPLGDTWLYRPSGWTQHLGAGPPAASDCRMAYDSNRDMTVLLHPNGETWEWNGLVWRLVGAVGAPAWVEPGVVFRPNTGPWLNGELIAVQQAPGGVATYRYTPSPARYQITSNATCGVSSSLALELDAHERSLPILGQSLHLRAHGVPQASLMFGAVELAGLKVPAVPIGCGCTITLAGVNPILSLVPFAGGPRDWFLPIANIPALVGVPIDVQALVVNNNNPCWLMSSQGGRLVPGF